MKPHNQKLFQHYPWDFMNQATPRCRSRGRCFPNVVAIAPNLARHCFFINTKELKRLSRNTRRGKEHFWFVLAAETDDWCYRTFSWYI